MTEMGGVKYAQSGEIVTGSNNEIITSGPLGSCIAVVAYDAKRKTGGIAHIMLPGKPHEESVDNKNKYVDNAIESLLEKLRVSGSLFVNIGICLAGGANVLKDKGGTIGEDVFNSVKKTLVKNKIVIYKTTIGGFERRNVTINIKTGVVNYTIGDSKEKELWRFIK